jgi:hypothetical protein
MEFQKHTIPANIKAKSIIPINKGIIVSDMNFGERIHKGIVLLSDNEKDEGIKPRWAKVYAVGPKQKEISVGQWVLISHGRWTRGYNFIDEVTNEEILLRNIDPKDILMTYNGRHRPQD